MALKKKNEIKPISSAVALLMVLAAFSLMGIFVAYLVSPSNSMMHNNNDETTYIESVDENSFIDESSYEPPPVIIEIKDTMADAEVGDAVKFGTFEQNGIDDGAEPIEWIVLEKQEDKILLVSRYALLCAPYNNERAEVSWENSSLRDYLNGIFVNEAFSIKETIALVRTDLNSDESETASSGDRVFILSAEESAKYYQYDSWRTVTAVDAISSSVGSDNGNCWYWLRDNGTVANSAAYVYHNGSIQTAGFAVDYDKVAVRPCIWVSADTETDLGDESNDESQEVSDNISE